MKHESHCGTVTKMWGRSCTCKATAHGKRLSDEIIRANNMAHWLSVALDVIAGRAPPSHRDSSLKSAAAELHMDHMTNPRMDWCKPWEQGD